MTKCRSAAEFQTLVTRSAGEGAPLMLDRELVRLCLVWEDSVCL